MGGAHSRRLKRSVLAVLVPFLLSLAIGPHLLAGRASADVVVNFADINPNQSDLDPTDPDGASGGRTNHLASVAGNNNAYYAATEWGGLYRSNDGGLTWAHLDGHVPQVTWDVKVDPSNTQRVYATSYYDGRVNSLAGINVSTDGGTTWTHPATATPPPAYNCAAVRKSEPAAFGIGIRPDAPNIVFVGTNCGVARSTDSGVTWTFVDPTPATPASDVWSVVVQAGGPMGQGIVDICGDDGHLRSVDGGNTWTASAGPLPAGRCSLAVSPDESYVLFAVVGTQLFESDDAGANWTNLGNPTPQGRIPFVKTNQRANVGPTNVFDLWFGDVSLFRVACTTPTPPALGGALRCAPAPNPIAPPWFGPFTRSTGAHDDSGDIAFDSQAAVDACPRLFTSDGGIYRNLNTASPGCHTPAWEQPNVTPHATWLYTMAGARQVMPSVAEHLYFGLQDNGSFASTNASAPTPTWHNADCCDGHNFAAEAARALYTICCFSPAPGNRLFLRPTGLVGGGQVPAASRPPGAIISFNPATGAGIANFGNQQYVVITTSGVFITLNVTASPIVWTQLTGSPAAACAVKVGVTGGTPTFYVQAGQCDGRSGDQVWRYTGTAPGGTWTRIDNQGGVTGGLSIFAVDPNNPNRLYAANLAPTGPRMIRTTDGGTTWTADPVLDNLMTAGGVFQYRNQRGPAAPQGFAGANFIGYPQPTLLAYDPFAANIIVAGGTDSGVFVSTNNGANWVRLTDPFTPGISGKPHLPRPRFAFFDHDTPGLVNLYVGTQGRGVWRLGLSAAPVITCVDNATGALRQIKATATPSGTGQNRACSAGETQVSWPGSLGPDPLVYACSNDNTGALRITAGAPSVTGTGQNRACSTGETPQTWSSSAGPPPLIYACVSDSTGALRIITSAATPSGTGQNRACSAGETQRTWPAT